MRFRLLHDSGCVRIEIDYDLLESASVCISISAQIQSVHYRRSKSNTCSADYLRWLVSEELKGITDEQRSELRAMLDRLGRLWSELTIAAADRDQQRMENIRAEIAVCRNRVNQIRQSGTRGSA